MSVGDNGIGQQKPVAQNNGTTPHNGCPKNLRVLLVEDCQADVELCMTELTGCGFNPQFDVAATPGEVVERLAASEHDVVISAYILPGWSGSDVLRLVQKRSPEMPVIILTGKVGEEIATEMIQQGAADFVLKSRLGQLCIAVHRALREKLLREERRRAQEQREEVTAHLRERVREVSCLYSISSIIQSTPDRDNMLTRVAARVPAGWGHPEAARARIRLDGMDYVSAKFEESKWRQAADLRIAGETRGQVEVFYTEPCTHKDEGPFLYEERQLIQAIARIVSQALEQNRIQAQLRQAQKMEAVGQLAGGVAHDFNNLLNIIIGYSELALERHNLSEPVKGIVTEVRKAGERAASLTRQLLAFSRKQMLAPKVLDLNEVTRDISDMVRRMVGEDVRVETVCADNLWHVKADPDQITQVIMNLASNARDAMPKGGRLTITTSNAELTGESTERRVTMPVGKYVLMAVSDTGMGMDERTQAHLFEPFFSTKERGKGTGLGLATVYGIVKQSGGYVWVESEVGHGSTFKIYLPKVDCPAEPVKGARVETRAADGAETVLIVEDEEGVRTLVRDYLQTRGYNMLQASNGDEAIRVARECAGNIDLLITDVIMPGMYGSECAQRLRAAKPNMSVLYISGYTEAAAHQRGNLEAGAPFLQKPFTPAQLASRVRGILDRKSVLST